MTETEAKAKTKAKTKARPARSEEQSPAEIAAHLKKLEATNRRLGWLTAAGLAAIALLAAAIILWPPDDAARIAALEAKIEADLREAQSKKSWFEVKQEEWAAQAQALETQLAETQAQVDSVVTAGRAISDDVLGPNAGALEDRIAALEAHVAAAGEPESLSAFLEQLGVLQVTQAGQAQLNAAVAQLSQAAASGQASAGAALAEARAQSAVLQETFADVPDSELKAAALLLAMGQFRSSLDRGDVPFADDLALLKNLVGNADPELTAALERLAPHAESGVLTPDGLEAEFKALAGEAVVASLSGKDVDLRQRAAARFHEIVQVEKDGTPVTGTQTQAALGEAETALELGDIEAAMAALEGLNPQAAQVMAPWIADAQAALAAQDVAALLGLKGELIHDEAAGVNVYRPAPRNGATY